MHNYFLSIKKALFPFIPSPFLKLYYWIKRLSLPKTREYAETGNNYALKKKIVLNKNILNDEKIDSIKTIQYFKWENPFNCSDYGKYQYKEKNFKLDGETEIIISFPNFGVWTLVIMYIREEKTIIEEIRTINVEAQEYNIAYLAATLPVLFFLFYIFKISAPNSPTIVGLERLLFNYKALPRNTYPFPLASEEELNTAYKGFNAYAQRLVYYIGTLYKMNPNARFNLFLCDHQAYFVLPLLYANRIPEKNFTVYLLSDGVGSYNCVNHIFGQQGAEEVYLRMCDIWRLSKHKAIESGVQQWNKEDFVRCGNPSVSYAKPVNKSGLDISNRFAYAYIMTMENSNFKWILHDPCLLKQSNNIIKHLPSKIQKINFKDEITRLKLHKSELISLFGIDFSVFDKSNYAGKKICLLLCSSPPTFNDEKYIDATVKLLGANYDYYLKDHPWNSVDKNRIQKYRNKGLIILDSKIPTEVYMMINPKVFICGYCSSVFLSLELLEKPSAQVLSVWNSSNCKIKTNCLDFTAKTAMNIESDKVVIYEK